MTSSAGASGLISSALPPRRVIASRIAARSTIAGTPVKSCMITRAGVKEISYDGRGLRIPVQQRLDVGARDVGAVLEAQQVLEQDLERIGQARDIVRTQRRQAPDLVGLQRPT